MANQEKLHATLRAIKENIDRWNQNVWVEGRGCGTSFCFAGWACVLDGWRPVVDEDGWATSNIDHPATGRHGEIEYVAMDILDLNETEASVLFLDLNRMEDLERQIEAVLCGYYTESEES